jgi:cytidylate kinase
VGRGAVVVLADNQVATHVRLDGSKIVRFRRTMDRFDLARREATRIVGSADHAMRRYWQLRYGVNIDDPRLYHVVLDSAATPLCKCVSVIAASAHR